MLEHHRVPITVYIAPGLTNGQADLWWDVLEAVIAARDTVEVETASGSVAYDCSTDSAQDRGQHRDPQLAHHRSAGRTDRTGGA